MKQLLLLYLGLGIPYVIVRGGAILDVALKTLGLLGVLLMFIVVGLLVQKVTEIRLGNKKLNQIMHENADEVIKKKEELEKAHHTNPGIHFHTDIKFSERLIYHIQVIFIVSLMELLNSMMIVDALMHQVYALLIGSILMPIVTGFLNAEAIENFKKS